MASEKRRGRPPKDPNAKPGTRSGKPWFMRLPADLAVRLEQFVEAFARDNPRIEKSAVVIKALDVYLKERGF